MEERTVTVEGVTYSLPLPFMVMATQNPIEYEGTFPLPEAQLDRFLVVIKLGYPTMQEELDIIEGQRMGHPIDELEPVVNSEEIVKMQEITRGVYVDELIKQYVVTIVEATRDHEDISLGSSPRGSLALFRVAQAQALIRGRDFVLPDDVKEQAVAVLSHRIIVSAAARMRGTSGREVISGIVDQIPVPGAQAQGWLRR